MAARGKGGKRLAVALVVAALGIGLGLGSAWLSLGLYLRWARVSDGPWQTLTEAGSPQADPYTRAIVALGGLLALDKSETIYFTADTDAGGKPLDGRCDYRVEGADPDARWWSLTLYGADRFLVKNAENRFSYSGTSLAREPGGGFVVRVSASEKPGNWLPSGGETRFFLALRLYNPAPALAAAPAQAPLPRIITERCP